MDLIYTCYTATTKHRRRRNAANANENLTVESPAASICCVSPRNVLLFTTSSQNHLFKSTTNQESGSVPEFGVENSSNSGGGSSVSAAKHSVFVCDLNTPWEVSYMMRRSWFKSTKFTKLRGNIFQSMLLHL